MNATAYVALAGGVFFHVPFFDSTSYGWPFSFGRMTVQKQMWLSPAVTRKSFAPKALATCAGAQCTPQTAGGLPFCAWPSKTGVFSSVRSHTLSEWRSSAPTVTRCVESGVNASAATMRSIAGGCVMPMRKSSAHVSISIRTRTRARSST